MADRQVFQNACLFTRMIKFNNEIIIFILIKYRKNNDYNIH